jgi:hypothetical protein
MHLPCLTLKLAILPALIFTALIGLIRSQPYDDLELREFLTPPERCPAPCFMGIRPGVTALDDALAVLRDDERIVEVDANMATERVSFIWNVESPAYPSTMLAENGVVRAIFIPTRAPLLDYWLMYGAPEQVAGLASTSNISYTLRYPDQKTEVWFTQDFPINQGLEHLLALEITLVFSAALDEDRSARLNPTLRDFLDGDAITKFG